MDIFDICHLSFNILYFYLYYTLFSISSSGVNSLLNSMRLVSDMLMYCLFMHYNKSSTFSLFYDGLSEKMTVVRKKLYGLYTLLSTCMVILVANGDHFAKENLSTLFDSANLQVPFCSPWRVNYIGSLQNSEMYVDVTNCSN